MSQTVISEIKTSRFSLPRIRLSSLQWLAVANAIGILAFAVFFRLYEVENIPGVNGDEALMTVQVTEATAGRPTVLKMPTGRMLSPIYGTVLLFTETFFQNSFWTLRSPAFLSGILVLIFMLWWLPRTLSRRVSILATLIGASMPVAIAYSRVGIEQCLIPLFSFFCVYASLTGRWKSLAISFFLALLVHPVNVFLVPVLIGPMAAGILASDRFNRYQKQSMIVGAALLLYLGILAEIYLLPAQYESLIGIHQIWGRLTHFGYFGEYLLHLGRLLSGVTAYEQYVALLSDNWRMAMDIGFWFIFSVVFFAGMYQAFRLRKFREMGLVLGFLASAFGFYLITGHNGITPGLARYALFLLIPYAVVLAVLIDLSCSARPKSEVWSWSLVSVICWGMLAQFSIFYFSKFHQHGSEPHRTYWSGSVEPKAAAMNWIRSQSTAGKPTFLIAEDWWTYWPLRYLSIPMDQTKVFYLLTNHDDIPHFPLREELTRAEEIKEVLNLGGFAVGFPGGPFSQLLPSLFSPAAIETKTIQGYGGKTILQVYRLRRS